MSKSTLTESEKRLVDLLFTEECKGDPQKAAQLAGHNDPFSKALLVAIRQKTEEFLHLNAPRAALKLLWLLENPSALGAKTQLSTIKEILGITGIFQKEDKQAQTIIQPLIMLPSKRTLEEIPSEQRIMIEAKNYDVVQASQTQAESLKEQLTITDVSFTEQSRTR